MILFAKEMERRTEHTKASRAERKPAFTRPNQWESSTRYETRGNRPVPNPRRNAERRTWSVNQGTSIQSPYQAPRHRTDDSLMRGQMFDGPGFPSSGVPGSSDTLNRGFRKGQWGGSPMMTQPINGTITPEQNAQVMAEKKGHTVQSQASTSMMSAPKMTEHSPYKGFVLDPRLSEMAVKPGGWTPPRETSQGIKIPNRNGHRTAVAQERPTLNGAGAPTDAQGGTYPWREVPQTPIGGASGLTVEQELAQKRARTRAFLPDRKTGPETQTAPFGAAERVLETNERVRPNEGVRPAGLADGGHFIPPRKELVG
jgi:hypothetical protein